MANSRPRAVPRAPRRKVDEDAVRALEKKLEDEEQGSLSPLRAVPTPVPAPPRILAEPPPVMTAPAAPPAVVPQARKPASLQARQGTKSHPHIRRDGTATRGSTVHFPVALHQQLKVAAAASDRRISEIVSEAVADWLARH